MHSNARFAGCVQLCCRFPGCRWGLPFPSGTCLHPRWFVNPSRCGPEPWLRLLRCASWGYRSQWLWPYRPGFLLLQSRPRLFRPIPWSGILRSRNPPMDPPRGRCWFLPGCRSGCYGRCAPRNRLAGRWLRPMRWCVRTGYDPGQRPWLRYMCGPRCCRDPAR